MNDGNDELNLPYRVVLQEVLAAARDAARDAATSREAFDQGRVMAYYDMLDIAKEQAELLELPMEGIGLAGFDPDELLRPPQSGA